MSVINCFVFCNCDKQSRCRNSSRHRVPFPDTGAGREQHVAVPRQGTDRGIPLYLGGHRFVAAAHVSGVEQLLHLPGGQVLAVPFRRNEHPHPVHGRRRGHRQMPCGSPTSANQLSRFVVAENLYAILRHRRHGRRNPARRFGGIRRFRLLRLRDSHGGCCRSGSYRSIGIHVRHFCRAILPAARVAAATAGLPRSARRCFR